MNKKIGALLEQGVGSAFNFIIPVIIARFYSDGVLAKYFIIFNMALFFHSLIRAFYITPFLVKSLEYIDNPIRTTYWVQLTNEFFLHVLIIFMGGLVIASGFIFLDVFDSKFIFLTILYLLSCFLREYLRGFLLASMKFNISFFAVTAQLTGLCAAQFFGVVGQGAAQIFLLLAMSNCIYILVVYLSGNVIFDLKSGFLARPERSYHLFFGKWSALNGCLQSAMTQSVLLMLFFFYGEKEVAIYGVLLSCSNLMSPIYQAMNNYLSPYMKKYLISNGAQKSLKMARKIELMLFVSIAIVAAVYYYFSDFLLLLYGGDYNSYASLLVVLVVIMAFQGVSYPYSRLANALNYPKLVFTTGIISISSFFILSPSILFLEWAYWVVVVLVGAKFSSYLYIKCFFKKYEANSKL